MNSTTTSSRLKPFSSLFALFALVVCSACLLWQPPWRISSVAAGADGTTFSTARALALVEKLSVQPHPTASPALGRVRALLTDELRAAGLDVTEQTGWAVGTAGHTAGQVHNLLVRIPGTQSGKALLLSAHYDSTPFSPGAADNAASVAAVLEALRPYTHGKRLRNDVIVLFSDGEEMNSLGAELFVAAHPWAKDVGMALNFDYRGSSGPILMFESSEDNGRLIGTLAGAPHAAGSSLMFEVYRRMRNSTDFAAFKNAGVPGMNFAAIENDVVYHTANDSAAAVNRTTLQHQGELISYLIAQYGNQDLLAAGTENHVYFTVPLLGMVHYPASWAVPLVLLASGLALWATVRAARTRRIRVIRMLLAWLVLLPVTALLAGAAQLLWFGVVRVHHDYTLIRAIPQANWYLFAALSLVFALYRVLFRMLRRWWTVTELCLGGMTWILLLAWVTALAAPGASYLFVWPVVFGLAALLADMKWPATGPGAASAGTLPTVVATLAMLPAVVLMVPVIYNLYLALSGRVLAAPALVFVLLLGFGMLLWERIGQSRPLSATLAALGVACLLMGGRGQLAHPDQLVYTQLGDSGRAIWLSDDVSLDSWTQTIFSNHAVKRPVPEVYGDDPWPMWVASAPALGLPAPQLEVRGDSVADGLRTLRLHIATRRDAPYLSLEVLGTPVLKSQVANLSYNARPRDHWSLNAVGVGAAGTDLTLYLAPGHPFTLKLLDASYGLPATLVGPRPATVAAQPFGLNDTTQVLVMKHMN